MQHLPSQEIYPEKRCRSPMDFQAEVLKRFNDLENEVNRCHTSLAAKIEVLAKYNAVFPANHLLSPQESVRRSSTFSARQSMSLQCSQDRKDDRVHSIGSIGTLNEESPREVRCNGEDCSCAEFSSNSTSRQGSKEPNSMTIVPKPSAAWVHPASSMDVNQSMNLSGSQSQSSRSFWSQKPTEEDAHYDHVTCTRKIWNFLENPNSSTGAKIYDRVQPCILFATVLFTLSQTVEDLNMSQDVCSALEILIEFLFAVEISLRAVVSPLRGLQFILEPFDAIDILTTLPLLVRLPMLVISVGKLEREFFFCIVATLRLLKMMRRFRTIHLLVEAFQRAIEALPVLIFTLFTLVLFFASIVFLVEPRDGQITTLSQSIWFTVVTMTTVGYGDIVPVSTPGTCVVTVLAISSVLYMAMPLGIVGHAFTQVWMDRDRILLSKRIQDILRQWGYTVFDIPLVIAIFDTNGRGQLNITDFRKLLDQMNLGLSNTRVVELFHVMDKNSNGYIEDTELVRLVFPDRFHELFGDDLSSNRATKCTCGNMVMPDATFCRKCGKKVRHPSQAAPPEQKRRRETIKSQAIARRCECGSFLMPDAVFCRKCGQDAGKANAVNVAELYRLRRNSLSASTGSHRESVFGPVGSGERSASFAARPSFIWETADR